MAGRIEQIIDEELGIIRVRTNVRAKNVVFRMKENVLVMTLPPRATNKEIHKIIESHKPDLLSMVRKRLNTVHIISPGYVIDAPLFHFCIQEYDGMKIQFLHNGCENKLLCPSSSDYNDNDFQQLIRKIIINRMVAFAKDVFPNMLDKLSCKYKLPYCKLHISKAQTRWGSCSSQKHISLNCYILLLPLDLVEFVMVHELCHTKEMNHGPKFWTLLNKCTDNKAEALREEIKKYKCYL